MAGSKNQGSRHDYHQERLDDVNTRLSRMEGEFKSLATKEDLANAKLSMISFWIAVGAMLTAIASVLLRFWPT